MLMDFLPPPRMRLWVLVALLLSGNIIMASLLFLFPTHTQDDSTSQTTSVVNNCPPKTSPDVDERLRKLTQELDVCSNATLEYDREVSNLNHTIEEMQTSNHHAIKELTSALETAESLIMVLKEDNQKHQLKISQFVEDERKRQQVPDLQEFCNPISEEILQQLTYSSALEQGDWPSSSVACTTNSSFYTRKCRIRHLQMDVTFYNSSLPKEHPRTFESPPTVFRCGKPEEPMKCFNGSTMYFANNCTLKQRGISIIPFNRLVGGQTASISLQRSEQMLARHCNVTFSRPAILVDRLRPGNVFHRVVDDFFTTYLFKKRFRLLEKKDLDIVVIDGFHKGKFFEFFKIFSDREPILLNEFYLQPNKSEEELVQQGRNIACFEEAYLMAGWHPHHGISWSCNLYSKPWPEMMEFADLMLRELDIPLFPSSPNITITIVQRRHTRRILNIEELSNRLSTLEALAIEQFQNKSKWVGNISIFPPQFQFQVVELEGIPFRDQIALFRSSDIVIAAHGAALVHAMFMAPQAVVIELFSWEYFACLYRNMAKFTGHYYMEYRVRRKEDTKHGWGKLDNGYTRKQADFRIDLDEFMPIFESALRMAQTFRGLSRPRIEQVKSKVK